MLPTIAAAAFLGLLFGRVFVPLRRRTSASPRRPQARRLARLHTRRSGAAVEVEACRCCFVVQSGGFRLQQASSGRRRSLGDRPGGGRVAPELEKEGPSRLGAYAAIAVAARACAWMDYSLLAEPMQ